MAQAQMTFSSANSTTSLTRTNLFPLSLITSSDLERECDTEKTLPLNPTLRLSVRASFALPNKTSDVPTQSKARAAIDEA